MSPYAARRRASFASVATALVLALLWARQGRAEDGVGAMRPWAENVAPEQEEQARKLFAMGNDHLAEAEFDAALALYEGAIVEWDHPRIRFNMMVALDRMNRPVEAYESLLAALRFGPEGLDPNVYAKALEYKTELETRVAGLEVVCTEPDARVTLNGKLLFIGPGKLHLWVSIGDHLVVGQRPDRRTISESITVEPNRANRVQLDGWPVETQTVLVSRWATWKPWLVVGAGAVTAVAGLPLEWQARQGMSSFEQKVADCGMPRCPFTAELQSLYNRSRWQNRVALGAFATGGALLVTGLALVILNRPRERTISRMVVVPHVSEERALVSAAFSF